MTYTALGASTTQGSFNQKLRRVLRKCNIKQRIALTKLYQNTRP